jgi:hypothetical protein
VCEREREREREREQYRRKVQMHLGEFIQSIVEAIDMLP